MGFEIVILVLCVVLAIAVTWIAASSIYQKRLISLQAENAELKSHIQLNENIINEVKAEFSKIAQESLKNQQEQLISMHSTDLTNKMDIFKAQEINPINKLLKDFKDSIDNYQKSHENESLEIKNAIATAEKYARALTTDQNSKGEFGEDWLEQILKFTNLEENIHYTKQFSTASVKPDFILNLPEDKHLIIDSKVILKNYIDYRTTNDESLKKAFITDLNNCINSLAKKNYEEIPQTNQPGFILMFIPIESCVNLIYTDYEFKKIIESANSKNIIIIGTASLIVTLRLINQIWTTKTSYDNIKNIITVGENLYNNIASHAQNLMNIQQAIEKASDSIQTEINRFTTRNNGSIFKEAEKLRDFGIESKSSKTGKKLVENAIPNKLLDVKGE
ncbi:DNA recombination protein RmuC [bacterium]|nr:DNA recombination protein RmuC [bacterium]